MLKVSLINKVFVQLLAIMSLLASSTCVFANQSLPDASIDSLELLLIQELNVTKKAHYHDQLGKVFYQNQEYAKALTHLTESVTIYSGNNDKHNLLIAYELIGIIYSELSDNEKALSYFLMGIKIAEKFHDKKAYNSLLLNIGTSYLDVENTDKGIYYLKKVIPFYENKVNKSPKHLVACYTNLGIAYKYKGFKDSSLFYFNKALDITKKEKLKDLSSGPLINLGDYYSEQKDYSTALTYYGKALRNFEDSGDERGAWHTKVGMADIFINTNKKPVAIDTLNKAVEYFAKINDLSYLKDCLKKLSRLYKEEGNFEQSLVYFERYMEVKDKLSKEEMRSKMELLQLEYDLDQLEKENSTKLNLLEKEKKIVSLWWILSSIVLILILVVIISRLIRNKDIQQLTKIRLQNTQLERNQLKSELQYRNKELENFALHIVQKNELLNELKSDLKKLKNRSAEKDNALVNTVTMKVNQALQQDKDLEKFRERVDEVNSTFFKVLERKFPELTSKEKKLCALLKLNLSSKEISALNNVSEGAITMARYRLRKKLGLQHDENLASFFENMD